VAEPSSPRDYEGWFFRHRPFAVVDDRTVAEPDGTVWCRSSFRASASPSSYPQVETPVVVVPVEDFSLIPPRMGRAWSGIIKEARRTPIGRWEVRVRMTEPLPSEAFTSGVALGSEYQWQQGASARGRPIADIPVMVPFKP